MPMNALRELADLAGWDPARLDAATLLPLGAPKPLRHMTGMSAGRCAHCEAGGRLYGRVAARAAAG